MTLLLDRASTPEAGPPDVAALLGVDHGAGGRRLVCVFCGHDVTSERARIEVAGAHEHTRVNPAGFAFNLGCFSEAPGCTGVGPEVGEHTWFAGYTWQIALCGRCGAHLGWVFRRERDRFHGLVLPRLRLEEQGAPDA